MRSPRPTPWLLAAVLFTAYSLLSTGRHIQLKSNAYDLGIFEEAVRSLAYLRPPYADIKGPDFNLWGDHFHPILMLIAPLYRLLPGPLTLLVVQAALFAFSAVPVTRLAIDWLGHRAGVCIGLSYGLSWGLQQALAFDFHEIAFAVPLLAVSLVRLAHRRWSAAVGWALPLLLVKEDQAFIVAAIGAYIFWQGGRRLGALTATGALAVQALVILVVIPFFNPHHRYTYGHTAELTQDNPLLQLLTPMTKEQTLLALLVPVLFVALRSPLLLLAVPTLGARFWSSNSAYWGTGYHYSAVLMPILFIALIDGLHRLRTSGSVKFHRALQTAPAASLGVALLWAVFTHQPLGQLAETGFWRVPAKVEAAKSLLASIPDGARVAASNRLAPQLTSRCRVFLYPEQPTADLRPEWLAITDGPGISPVPAWLEEAATARLPQYGYAQVAKGGGIVLYRLVPPGSRK